MAYAFGEIRPFTPEEIGWMNGTLKMVGDKIIERGRKLDASALNPFNYVLETQRDALTRARNLLEADMRNAGQLRDTRDAVIESGDTDRLARWFALANTIIDPGADRAFNAQIAYSSTATTAANVAGDTAKDLGNPFKWPWWVWAIGGVAVLGFVVPRRK